MGFELCAVSMWSKSARKREGALEHILEIVNIVLYMPDNDRDSCR